MSRTLITQMLEALEILTHGDGVTVSEEIAVHDTITAAREYLAAPEQSEPYCVMRGRFGVVMLLP